MITARDRSKRYQQLYNRLLDTVETAYREVENNGEVQQDTYDHLKQHMGQLYNEIPGKPERARDFTAFVRNQPGDKTTTHATNTALYKAALLKVLRHRDLPFLEHREQAEDVSALTGMALHDIGKKKLDRELVNLARELTDEEYEQIKDHTDLGIEALPETEKPARDIIENHHERPDGSGYEGKEELHAYEQISGIIDVFDALNSDRPYHEKKNAGETVEVIEEEFGPHPDLRPVLNTFYDTLQAFPSGQLIRHESGAIVQVAEADRQSVRTIVDRNNSIPESFELQPGEIQRGLDLTAVSADETEAIKKALSQNGQVEHEALQRQSS